ncbi:MAG: hypothetical protein ACOZNI_03165 [Myxococcota bacterium]
MLVAGLAAAAEITAGGRLEGHVRVATTGCAPATVVDCGYVDFHDAAVLGGELRADFARKVRVAAAADLRAHAGTELDDLDDSGVAEVLQPLSIKVHRASATMSGEHVDWLAGADTLRWGVADGINPVDLLNPYDLEDPTRFDRRLAVPLLAGTVHGQRWAVQAAWAPFFVPAALPTDQVNLLAGAGELFETASDGVAEVNEVESRVTVPPRTLENGSVAARASLSAGPADVALSYFHGRDSLPQVGGEILLIGFQTDEDRVDVGIPVIYPRMDVAGLEARGELWWEVGGWVEAALVFPARVEATMSEGQLVALAELGTIDEVPDPIPVTVTQDGHPFARWVVGLDRAFGRVYLNVQWLHGFPTERQLAELRDYGMVFARITLADRWVLGLRGVSDAKGWLAGGELAYLHGDAAELTLGGTWIDGAEGSALRGFRGVSHVGTGVTVKF